MQDLLKYIPEELKLNALWCCWKYIRNEDGDLIKKPFNVLNGYGAKSNDKKTFVSYPTMCRYLNDYLVVAGAKVLGGAGLGIFEIYPINCHHGCNFGVCFGSNFLCIPNAQNPQNQPCSNHQNSRGVVCPQKYNFTKQSILLPKIVQFYPRLPKTELDKFAKKQPRTRDFPQIVQFSPNLYTLLRKRTKLLGKVQLPTNLDTFFHQSTKLPKMWYVYP